MNFAGILFVFGEETWSVTLRHDVLSHSKENVNV